MTTTLLISEKPSVAKEYCKLLSKAEGENFTYHDGYYQGSRFTVSWCVGHLVQLAMPSSYGYSWSHETLPMLPEQWIFEPKPDTKDQFMILKNLIESHSVIINGADAGREGELIYRNVIRLCDMADKDQKRLWLNSFVLDDMIKAWNNLSDSSKYDQLFNAADCRSKADWLIGMNFSTLYRSLTSEDVSVGRVQTPTLFLVAKREFQNNNFDSLPEPYRKYLQLTGKLGPVKLMYQGIDNRSKFELSEYADLEQIKSDLLLSTLTITQLKNTTVAASPPKPFDLGSLQKEANKKLGFTASKTLKIAQKLYEDKLTTYPRTDSSYLPESMLEECFDTLTLHRSELSLNEQHFVVNGTVLPFFNSKNVTDHYAIIPTTITPKDAGLSKDESTLYSLILHRFLVAFGNKKQSSQYSLILSKNDFQDSDPLHSLTATVSNVTYAGFELIFPSPQNDTNPNDALSKAKAFEFLETLTEGQAVKVDRLDIAKKSRTKPALHNEASLLDAMDTAGKEIDNEDLRNAMKAKGLGTPATKASIIETLKTRGLIQSKGKSLITTSKGAALLKLLPKELKSPLLTGEWEFQLSKVEAGALSAASFYSSISNFVLQHIDFDPTKVNTFIKKMSEARPKCPSCKSSTLQKTKYSYACVAKCGFKINTTIAQKTISETIIQQLCSEGITRVIKGFTGRNGKFDAALTLFHNAKRDNALDVTFQFQSKKNKSSK